MPPCTRTPYYHLGGLQIPSYPHPSLPQNPYPRPSLHTEPVFLPKSTYIQSLATAVLLLPQVCRTPTRYPKPTYSRQNPCLMSAEPLFPLKSATEPLFPLKSTYRALACPKSTEPLVVSLLQVCRTPTTAPGLHTGPLPQPSLQNPYSHPRLLQNYGWQITSSPF